MLEYYMASDLMHSHLIKCINLGICYISVQYWNNKHRQGFKRKDPFVAHIVLTPYKPLHFSSLCFSLLLCIHSSQWVWQDVPYSGRIILVNWLQFFASASESMEVSLNKWNTNVSSNGNPISDGWNYFHTISTSIFKLWGTTDWFGHHSQSPVIKIRIGHLIQRHGV